MTAVVICGIGGHLGMGRDCYYKILTTLHLLVLREEYERRASVMVRQAETFSVHGLFLNGKLACGENIADLGGLKLALLALKSHLSLEGEGSVLINGFTPMLRIFLAWSQNWRENGETDFTLL